MLRQLGGEPAYAAKITRDIADGDLSVDIQLKAGDQSSLLYAMKTMRDGLADMVGRVRVGSESVASASVQIAQANIDLSRRTEQQAAALDNSLKHQARELVRVVEVFRLA